jgi:hypothetical protein
MNRRTFLGCATAILAHKANLAYAASPDPALLNNKLIILDVIEKIGSPELRGKIEVAKVRADLAQYLATALRDAGVQIAVQDRGKNLPAPPNAPPLTMLYVTLRIDLDIVPRNSSGALVVGAAGTFFQKAGMPAHQSTQPLTFFTARAETAEIERHVLEAGGAQLRQAVVEPVARWSR